MTLRQVFEKCLDYPLESINEVWLYLAGGILFLSVIGFMTLVVEVIFGWFQMCWRLGKTTIRSL